MSDSPSPEVLRLDRAHQRLRLSQKVLIWLLWGIAACVVAFLISGGWFVFTATGIVFVVALAVTAWVVNPRLQAEVDKGWQRLTPADRKFIDERTEKHQRFLDAIERMKQGW